jgi:DNA/RNA endonuclease YhcR with UshA esterase domain
MKASRIIRAILATLILTAFVLVLTIHPAIAAQKPEPGVVVPKYNPAAEVTIKGTVEEVRDRQCPVSGGLGSHLILRLATGNTIEVHLATTKFVKDYDFLFKKGDVVEVVGAKVQFEGVETIFAREVHRGDSAFVFRDKDGTPIW